MSLQKANALKTWMLADTTSLRWRSTRRLCRLARSGVGLLPLRIAASLARGRHPRVIHYDAIYKCRLTPREALEALSRESG